MCGDQNRASNGASRNRAKSGRDENLPTVGVIAVISGGPTGGDSHNIRMAQVRTANSHISKE